MTGRYSDLNFGVGHKLRGSRFEMIPNRSLPTPIYLIKSVLWSKVVGSKNTENIACPNIPPPKTYTKSIHKIHPIKIIYNHVIRYEPGWSIQLHWQSNRQSTFEIEILRSYHTYHHLRKMSPSQPITIWRLPGHHNTKMPIRNIPLSSFYELWFYRGRFWVAFDCNSIYEIAHFMELWIELYLNGYKTEHLKYSVTTLCT